ncbi:MAG: carboxypeptidase-like regulatory domain-containing protein [Ferruginibacter sp.]
MTNKISNQIPAYITLLLFFILAPFFCLSQQTSDLSGKVTNETGKPVNNCSVYFSNTSIGDVTADSGNFVLKNLPAGKYEMIISAIGYETIIIPVESNNYPSGLRITLHNISTQLSEVVVQAVVKNGWQKWGQVFMDNFIGTVPNARHCQITNPEVVKFWFSETKNRLTVRADEALIIENKALGYIIKFKLGEFVLDYNLQSLVYSGYPFFQEMKDTTGKKEGEWKENRSTAYYGSLLHFMRCVYNNQWQKMGYEIVTFSKQPNVEKQRVKKLLASAVPIQTDSLGKPANKENTPPPVPVTKDTSRYYRKILRQPDSLAAFAWLTTLDSLLVNSEGGSKSLFFKNKLKVHYRRRPKSKERQSEIYLGTPKAIRIEENGSYSPPKELIFSLHWSLTEKIANLLPFDYKP